MTDIDTFRAEIRNWIGEACPENIRGKGISFEGGAKEPVDPDMRRWVDACFERGFTVPSWPKEYGGAALDPERQQVLGEEMAAIRAPAPIVGMGVTMIGPTLLEYGICHEASVSSSIAVSISRAKTDSSSGSMMNITL